MLGLITFLSLGTCTAELCSTSGENVQLAFGLSNAQAYVQSGIWHRIPCPAYRPEEKLDGLVWYKGTSIHDQSKARLISRSSRGEFPTSDRYALWSGSSLVIRGVEEADQGRYLCQVIPQESGFRVRNVELRVIGTLFRTPNGTSSTQSLQRGRRQTLPCECAGQAPDVVYWSTGEGVTSDTQIIGARFADGATLQIQHGADYSIGSDASLTVNSLSDVQDTQRYWCHVFQLDGSLQNCYIDCTVLGEQPTAGPLKASERSFYLRTDARQTLPCVSWSPGDAACEVEWSQLDNPDPRVLCSYNLSTGVVDSGPEFDLGSDFGLVIRSVGDEHAGEYRCVVGNKSSEVVEVRVIGDHFPLDQGSATIGGTFTLQPGTSMTLQCPSLPCVAKTTKAHLFWSSAAPGAQTTSVIGSLSVPGGSVMPYAGHGCRTVTSEGALLLDNCTQDDVVRYWCHILPEGNFLLRSYVDVKPEKPEKPSAVDVADGCNSTTTVVVLAVLTACSSVLVLLAVIVACYLKIWRLRHPREGYAMTKITEDRPTAPSEVTS